MRAWMIPLLLLAGCDDTLFGVDTGAGTIYTGPLATGHAGVVAIFAEDCVSCHPAGGSGSVGRRRLSRSRAGGQRSGPASRRDPVRSTH